MSILEVLLPNTVDMVILFRLGVSLETNW
jgi:hypothetical protein